MTSIEAAEAAQILEQLIERAAASEEIVLTLHGRSAAHLIAIEQAAEDEALSPRVFGQMRGKMRIADDFDAPLPDEILDIVYDGPVELDA